MKTIIHSIIMVLVIVPLTSHATKYFSIGSCPVSCTAYTWSAGIADILNKNIEDIEATAEETKGYIANVALLQNGEIEAAMATSLSAYDAYHAKGAYAGSEQGKIMSWMSIAPVAMHVIALKDGPIKTLQDLKGKKVGMGQPGGTSMLDADILMNLLAGDDYKPFRVLLGDMVDMISDGNIDAALWNGSFPLSPVIKLAAQREMTLIDVPEDVLLKLKELNPPYFKLSIPANTYVDVEIDTPTYGLANALVVASDVDEDMVYQMTKVIFENLDKLTQVHPAFRNISSQTILNGLESPLHPGALKYYREINLPNIEDFVKRTMM